MILSLMREHIMKFTKSLINDCQLAISKAVSIALFLTPQSKNLHTEKYKKKNYATRIKYHLVRTGFHQRSEIFRNLVPKWEYNDVNQTKIGMGVVDSIQFDMKIRTLIHRMRF